MKIVAVISAAVLAGTAGLAVSAPVIDGQLGTDSYGTIRWVQNQPTNFGNNVAGTSGGIGDPQNVRTGVEIAVPLAAIGSPAPGAIKLCAFVNGQSHDYLANQVTGGTASNAGNFGDPRNVNFQTNANAPGNQFITLSPAVVGGTVALPEAAPVMDGSADGLDVLRYGAPKFTQNVFTGFGNNTQANGITCGGSELDAVYAFVWNNNTPADASDDVLYLTVAGNLETNFNKLEVFFDTQAGGQNRLLAGNSGVDGGGLQRMGDAGTGNGITFDAGFEPDYWIGVTNGSPGTPGFFQLFANFAELPTVPSGLGYYVGNGTPAAQPIGTDHAVNNSGGVLTPGDAGAPALLVSIDNANIAGVPGSPTNITRPNRDVAAGSEIDGLFATIDGGYLYVLVTGNLENNGNKLELFFDVDSSAASPEGQERLRFDNVSADYGGLLRECATDVTGVDGLKFETGFGADYWLSVANFGYPVENWAYASVLRLNGPEVDGSFFVLDYGSYDGGVKATNDPINFDGPRRDVQDQTLPGIYCNYGPRLTRSIADNPLGVPTANLLEIAIDNNNIGGVTGADVAPSVLDAANAIKGVEFRVRLDELGWDNTSPIRIAGFLTGSGRDSVSNQVLGGLNGFVEGDALSVAASLGDPRLLDLSLVAGTQYVEIATTPACPADLDDGSGSGTPDGGVDINDLLFFLVKFEAGAAAADLDDGSGQGIHDGGVDINDLLFFLVHFEQGC
jgi:hypothetical protein